MIILLEGINPEPWRSPRLGTQRVGGKVVPAAYKDENLRTFQEAIRETVEEELLTLGYELPLFEEHTPLVLDLAFWRQTESYQGEKRRNTRNRPDVTNMQKATEDALQGVLYKTDRWNISVRSTLVDVGALVEPRIVIDCRPEEASSWRTMMGSAVENIKRNGVISADGQVWTKA